MSIARSALFINQLGQRVVGNNIANANTPGYSARDMHQTTAPFQIYSNYNVGLGVKLAGITRRTNSQLLSQYRDALSDANGANTQTQTLQQLELLLGELGTNDVSSLLSQFFDSLNEVANQPESEGARQLVVQTAQLLTGRIQSIAKDARSVRTNLNNDIKLSADTVNFLIEDIAELNSQIRNIELAENGTDASTLRDQRDQLITQLAEYIDIDVIENENGTASILYNNAAIVSHERYQKLEVEQVITGGVQLYQVKLEANGIPITGGKGILGGLIAARDDIVGSFINDWDKFANTLIHGFNQLHAQGQGLDGYSQVTSSFQVEFPTKSLGNIDFEFPPKNGSFQILVTNPKTGETKTHDIAVQIDGSTTDTTFEDLVESINAIEGIQASIDASGKLQIVSDSENVEFSFANDNSGILTALEINSFFSGKDALSIDVSSIIASDPRKLASSLSGAGQDTKLITMLAAFGEQSLEQLGNRSIREGYESIVSDIALQSGSSQALANGLIDYASSLNEQFLALTGVNLDEEAIKMMRFEQAYQAATRFLQTVNEMLEVLLTI